ncbi:MAG: CRISPR system precrRNA processing endoribonuclease RAMP protein Cas6 [Chloroflexota bacterium]
MEHFTAHRLRFECEVVEIIQLNPHQGSAIRGAFYHALLNAFCMNHQASSCTACPLVATCPVAFLVATLDPQSDRGATVPRPYTIEPPLDGKTRYEPGEKLEFGLTMFARALNLFPYVVLGMQRLEQGGLGKRVPENGYRRGRFRVRAVWAENPLTGEHQPVLRQGETMVQVPDVPVTQEHVVRCASQEVCTEITLEFLTPTRLTDQKRLVKQPAFRVLFQRLMERLEALAKEFSDTPLDRRLKYDLVGQAAAVELVNDQTHWVELESYSTRLRRTTPISGFVGRATYRAVDWRPFLPWLVWGQFTHVGKDAVKGNGWLVFGP